VAERRKEFAQHLGLFAMLRHTIHFSLQLLGRDRLLPILFEQLRIAQVILHLLLDCCLRHYRIQRWLVIGALFWPDPMAPVHFFNCSLVSDTILKEKLPWLGRRSDLDAGIELNADKQNKGRQSAGQPRTKHFHIKTSY